MPSLPPEPLARGQGGEGRMTATVASPSGNAYAVLLALFTVTTFITVVVLWMHEKRWDRHGDTLDEHAEQLALLAGRIQSLADFLDVEITDPVDDSPEAVEGVEEPEGHTA